MKKSSLFSAILIIVSCSLLAQDPLHRKVFTDPAGRVNLSRHQIPMGPKPDRAMVGRNHTMFNPSNSVWKWDTILSYNTSSNDNPFQRVTRTYNSMGEVLTQMTERWQVSFNWVNMARETFTYDSAGNVLTYFAEKWENNAWTDFMKESTVYNVNGDRVDWRREIWQSTYWWKWGHYTWHYLAPGLYDTVLTQAGPDSLWVNTALEVDTYDTSGNMVTSLTYDWVNNGWVYDQLVTKTFDSINRCVSDISQDWQNSSWINFYRSDATYDTAGFWALFTGYIGQNNSWVNDSECRKEFDSAGNVLLSSVRGWSGNAWVNSYQYLYEYDGSNNLLKSTFQNGNSSGWQNTSRRQYTYDVSGNSLTGKWLKWSNGNWYPDNGILQVFSDHQVDYDIWLSDLYRYSVIGDSVMVPTESDPSVVRVTVYPNPAHTKVYVSMPGSSANPGEALTVYDIRGQIVLTKPVNYEKTELDIKDLTPGIYFMRFSGSQVTKLCKLIKD